MLARFALLYCVVAVGFALYHFQVAYQAQSHRLDDLSQKGILSVTGKLDRIRLAVLSADAAKNGACMEAHPPPPGQTGAWTPEECGPYLPRNAEADATDAIWASTHPGSRGLVGWAAAEDSLRAWALGFVPATVIVALVGWFFGRPEP